jgi:hypothetical protein
MSLKIYTLILILVLIGLNLSSAENLDYWRIDNEKAIVWDVHNETRLPHSDDIEMAGQRWRVY